MLVILILTRCSGIADEEQTKKGLGGQLPFLTL